MAENLGNERKLKLVSTLGFTLIVVAIILIILEGPSTGYETSIYEAYPKNVWWCLILGVAIGFGISIQQALSHDSDDNSWWARGLLIVLIGNLIILLLPLIRGYVLYGREDAMTHVGYAVDIVKSGYLSERDVYPIQHLLIAVISILSGLHPLEATSVFSAILSMLYVGFTYLLAKVVFDSSRSYRLATISSAVLLFSPMQYHASLVPSGFGVFLIPLIVYTFLKRQRSPTLSFGILVVLVVGFALPFVHPLVWVVMCSSLVIVAIMFHFLRSENINLFAARYVVLLISGVTFLTWFLRFYLTERLIRVVYDQFFNRDFNLTMMEQVLRSAKKVDYQVLDVLNLMGKFAGHDILFLVLSTIAIVVSTRKLLSKRNTVIEQDLIVLAPTLIIPGLFLIIHLFVTVLEFGIMRLVTIMVAITPIYVAYALSFLYSRYQKRKTYPRRQQSSAVPVTILSLLIFISWLIGFVSTYGWLFVKQANQQATRMEISGVVWLVDHRFASASADTNRVISRYADAIYGTKLSAETGIYRVSTTTSPIGALPDHFGYSDDTRLGELYSEDFYVPLSEYDRDFHEFFYPEFEQFDASDFEKLYRDTSAFKVFDNGEFEVWYINSKLDNDDGNK